MIATIGTAMGIVTLLLFLIIFLAERKPVPSTWPRAALFGLSVYFALASIVHPWYVVPLVALSVFTQFRFAIAWSVVVFLSYSAYTSADYTENLVLITVEYLVVYSIAAYELLNFWALSGNKKGPSTKAL